MEKEKALDVIKRQIDCYSNEEDKCFAVRACGDCKYNATLEEITEALHMAISALEKQTVDKCCETCKHKHLDVDMSDYISREDALKGQKTGTFANGICFEAKACVPVDYIESIEPADVASVVRCDDCVYYDSRRWCGLHSSVFDDNAFCSYGERREE